MTTNRTLDLQQINSQIELQVQSLKGILHREGMEKVSIEAMNGAVKQRVCEKKR